MDKKTIIALVICVLLLLFWGQITEYLGLTEPAPQRTEIQPAATDTVGIDTAGTQQPATQPQQIQDTVVSADTLGRQPDSVMAAETRRPEKTIHVTTPHYEMTFSTYGGGLKKIVLRDYHYIGNGNVILAESADKVVPNITSLDGSFSGNRLYFESNARDFELNKGDEPQKVTFVHDNGRGGRITKTFTINADTYDFGVDVSFEGIETFGLERDYHLVWGITPPPTEKNVEDDYGHFKVVAQMDDHIELDDFDNNRMSEDIPGHTVWAGLRTKYFAAVMIPETREGRGVIGRGTKEKQKINGDWVDARELTAAITMPISSIGSVSDSYTVYAGPIDYKILKSYNVGLEELTSLGWVIIKPFSIAIIWLLPKIYNIIPNYGVVVLIFALLIKIIVYPLSRKQTMAMTKLKDLQPKMKKLQERYKSDPQKLNKEMMKLYKEAGANPLSGCLPLLPQMPLFFALFTVFRTTIEFRGASFILWITDLSVKDPYYILPIIMVVTMFVQQKMTMTDPKNKMLVYLMPLFFGWLFMSFPAGLVLYWTGFNILSLVETIFIRKKQEQQEAVTVVEEKG